MESVSNRLHRTAKYKLERRSDYKSSASVTTMQSADESRRSDWLWLTGAILLVGLAAHGILLLTDHVIWDGWWCNIGPTKTQTRSGRSTQTVAERRAITASNCLDFAVNSQNDRSPMPATNEGRDEHGSED